jgi:hypothetical protein
MATHEPRLTAATVESPLPRNWHGGFGERPGETDRWQHRHCAPGRLNKWRSAGTRSPAAALARFQIVAKFPRRGVAPYGPTKTRPSEPVSANVSRWCLSSGTSHVGSATERTPACVLGSLITRSVPSSTMDRSILTDAFSRSMSERRNPISSPHRMEPNTASSTKTR